MALRKLKTVDFQNTIFYSVIGRCIKILSLHGTETTACVFGRKGCTVSLCGLQMVRPSQQLCKWKTECRWRSERDGKLAHKRKRVTHKLLTENVMEKSNGTLGFCWEKVIRVRVVFSEVTKTDSAQWFLEGKNSTLKQKKMSEESIYWASQCCKGENSWLYCR